MAVSAAPIRPRNSTGSERPHRFNAALALILIVLTGIAFLPVLRNGFVNFDDGEYVVGNEHVKAGLTREGVRWALGATQTGNWHPMTWLSHMVDCQLFGLEPWGHHLTNVILHIANALLVFFVFSRMTGSAWRSFFTAAIFAVHPLRVESVAWASERKDVLAAFFGLLTLWAYVTYVKTSHREVVKSEGPDIPNQKSKIKNQKSWPPYFLSLLFFLAGLLSKPSLVTLPFVLLLLDYWPLRRGASLKLVTEKAPYFLLAAGSSFVTFVAQHREGAVAAISHISLAMRLENAAISYLRYLGKMFWPADFSVYYPLPAHWPIGMVMFAVFFLVAITFGVVIVRRRWPFLLVGWFWFVGTLVPMIGLVQVGEQAMADRYTYISGLGVLIMLAWSVPEVSSQLIPRIAASAASVAILVLCAITRFHAGYWKDSESLFRHALAVSPDNYGARVNLGNALLSQRRIDEAIGEFQEAVRLRPELRLPRIQLTTALRAEGRIDDAIAQFDEILKLHPDDAAAHNELGALLFDKGRADDAISHYREAARLDPGAAATRYNWGIALYSQSRFDEAVAQLHEAVRLQPGNPRAHYNLGLALLRVGHTDDAIEQWRAAASMEPNAPKTHYQLGLALAKTGHTQEAIAQIRTALVLQPNYPEAAQELTKLIARP